MQYGRIPFNEKNLTVNLIKFKCRPSISRTNLASELRCAVSVKYTLHLEELAEENNVKYCINILILVVYQNVLDILSY